MKKIFFSSFLIFSILACNTSKSGSAESENSYITTQGRAQGTTWHITYKSLKGEDRTREFDSLLNIIDNSLSVYNKNSLITKINNNEDVAPDSLFVDVFNASVYLNEISKGMFDPTVFPLVSAWGFDRQHDYKVLTQTQVDSLLTYVGISKCKIVNNRLVKQNPKITLIFNAIAQGYSSDIIARYLDNIGIHDYLVEVGGEVYAKGLNSKGTLWNVGIDLPVDGSTEEDRVIQTVAPLSDAALCTSGNYRNFFIENGKKYSHELNAVTGFPTRDSILSVSVLAKNACLADGLATAVMSLGLKDGYHLIDSLPDIEGFFVYTDKNGDYKTVSTSGFKTVNISDDKEVK